MLVNLFQSTTIPALEQVVQFTQARHNVLASNIANLDTPGYRARDLSVDDFQSRLKEAIAAQHQPATPSPGEAVSQPREPFAGIARERDTILRHDDGNVLPEREVTEIIKNKGQHNLALSIMVSQFHLLQTAISERV